MRKLLTFVLLSIIVYGCSSDDNVISSLCFEKEYYEKPLLENSQEIVFSGGSDNLSIEVSDDDVLEATISNGKIVLMRLNRTAIKIHQIK